MIVMIDINRSSTSSPMDKAFHCGNLFKILTIALLKISYPFE